MSTADEAKESVEIVTMSTADEAEESVEIKIKTLDSQTYTLRVNKRVPVPALKEQIATITGVLSEQQRLICRGKVLRDDQLLSAYHVEDGHTLHLVSRQPIPSSSAPLASTMGLEGASGHQAFSSASSSSHNRTNHVARSFVFEAVNINQGDRSTSSLSRILSSVLNTIATATATATVGTGNARTDLRETVSEGPDIASSAGLPDVTHPQPSPAPRVDFNSRQTAFRFPSAVNLGFQHPAVIPDSLTTIHQYLGHMRDEFRREAFGYIGGELNNNVESSGMNVNEGHNHGFQSRPVSGQGGLPSPEFLAEIMLSARELLIEQAGERLSQLARQLENQASVTDTLTRTNIQSSAIRSGLLLQNLGSLLLELGRATMTLRMGQTPTEAMVNAGPASFLSASGPNPMMVQPVPFYPGSSFAGLHMGTANSGHGLEGQPLGSAYIPRDIDIRIHTGQAIPVATANLGEQAGAQQTQEQTDSARNSPGANFIHQTDSGGSGGVTFTGEPGVRVVPIRTVVAVPAGVSRSPSDSSGRPAGLFYPLFARIQQQNPGNMNDASGSQSSTERHPGGPEIDRQPILESSIPMGDGSHLPTNLTPVVSRMSPTNESAQYQGSSRVFISSQSQPTSNNNGSAQAHDGQQTGQGSVAQMSSRFGQWLRSVLTGQGVNVSGIGHQDSATDSATNQTSTTRNSEAQEGSVVGEDQGAFFSNLVRQLMPYISQGTAGVSPTYPNSSMPQVERENSTDPSNSKHCRDPPEAPNSKRPKRD